MDDIRKDCPMRHENGNCLPAGGFCTSVNVPICEALHGAYDCGRLYQMEEELTANIELKQKLNEIENLLSMIDADKLCEAIIPVRCKDCRYYKPYPSGNICDKVAYECTDSCFFQPPEDFYCPYGERREKE